MGAHIGGVAWVLESMRAEPGHAPARTKPVCGYGEAMISVAL